MQGESAGGRLFQKVCQIFQNLRRYAMAQSRHGNGLRRDVGALQSFVCHINTFRRNNVIGISLYQQNIRLGGNVFGGKIFGKNQRDAG